MADEREYPAWAERLRRERSARGWSQPDVVAAMRTFSEVPLPDGLLDQWKRVPPRQQSADEFLVVRSGMNTHELVRRIRRSSVDDSTLDGLAITVEQLCCEYSYRDPHDLIAASSNWVTQVTRLLDERLTLTQHRDILDAAGWLTLLVGCLEYDIGQLGEAHATRKAALQLGSDSETRRSRHGRFYAMDCYRLIGDNDLAEMHAREIIRKTTMVDGESSSPIRKAEAQITLGVVAARAGSLDQALSYGREALSIGRRSRPSLLLVGAELDHVLQQQFAQAPDARQFHEESAAATAAVG